MVEAPTLPLTAEEHATLNRHDAPPASRLRPLFLALIFVLPLALSVWGFNQLSKALDVAGPYLPPEQDVAEAVARIQHFKWTGTLALVGLACLTILLVRVAFAQLDRSWERSIEERKISWESTAMRLRTQLTDKIVSEEHLQQSHKTLEAKLAELKRLHEETLAELEARKKIPGQKLPPPPRFT
jgi:hypothetical protein